MRTLIARYPVVLAALLIAGHSLAATEQQTASVGTLSASLASLPAATVSTPHKLLRVSSAPQVEAEALFATSDAAVYVADTGELLSLVAGPATPTATASVLGIAGAEAPNQTAAGSGPGPLGSRVQVVEESTLADFAGLADRIVAAAKLRPGANYLVKFPSVKPRPDGGAQAQGTSIPVHTMDTEYTLYEDFEGDVWSRWSRGDNTGGRYQWAVKSCTAHGGSYSGDPVRGGSQGAYLGCFDNYPPSVKTWMYYTLCQTIPTDWTAWASLYLTGTIGTGADDYFAFYAADPSGYLYGYAYSGNFQGWFKITANLRQWPYLGDLGQYACNSLYLYFSSSANTPAGSGPSVDDIYIDVGPTASIYGECQAFADSTVGKAPLTVSFRGVTDLTYGSFYWDFGDGASSTSKNPAHTYTAPGTYVATFSATYNDVQCNASSTITVQPGAVCSYSLSAASASFGAGSGTGTVGVTSAASCAWTANSNASWITVTSGASGTGNGSVGYSVQANTGAARNGTLTVAGQTFTVYQAAQACSYSLAPQSAGLPASGGTGSFTVTSPSGCAWTATSSAGWLHVTAGSSGSGTGTVSYGADPNFGSARSATISVAGQMFTLSQDAVACTYSLGASAISFTYLGGGGNLAVAAPAGCPWTASTTFNWISISLGSGTGSGTLYYSVDANAGAARSGTITVQAQTFTVNEDGVSTLTSGYWLPVVIHKDVPSLNAQWRSDIAVLNRSSQTANLTLNMFASSGPQTMTIPVAGNGQLLLRDVAAQLGVMKDSGALEVVSDQDIFLTGRTYNQVDATHTYGQDYDGEQSSTMLTAGQSAWLPQLTQNALFRTNIGVTNTGSTSANVTLVLFDGQGNQLLSTSLNLASGQFYQFNQPYTQIPAGGIDNGYAVVTVNAGSGIVAYASVIDQNTGDPTTINMKR